MRKIYLLVTTLVVALTPLWSNTVNSLSEESIDNFTTANVDITGSTEVCSGDESIYKVSEMSGASYTWTVSNNMSYSQLANNVISVCWEKTSSSLNPELVSVEINSPSGVMTGELEVYMYALPNAEIQYSEICGITDGKINDDELAEVCPGAIEHNPIIPPSGEEYCINTCENAIATYMTNMTTGFQYEWKAIGGTIISSTNQNIVDVEWGNTQPASLSLTITNQNGCSTTKESCIHFMASPSADISADRVCLGQPTTFSVDNLDADHWTWVFPNGFTSDQLEPNYTFPTGGTHQVSLIIEKRQNYYVGTKVSDGNSGILYTCISCPCTVTLKLEVYVEPTKAPEIECVSTVCSNDVICYSTTADCSNYNWIVTGASNITEGGSNTDDFICIQWGNGPEGTISLAVDDCNDTYCSTPTEVTIPILGDQFIIEGEQVVCHNDKHIYQTTKYPGANYHWTVNGGSIVGNDNSSYINVIWDEPAPHNGSVDVYIDSEFLSPETSDGNCWGKYSLGIQTLDEFGIEYDQIACIGDESTYTANGAADWTVIGGIPISSTNNTNNIKVLWNVNAGLYDIIAIPTSDFCNEQDKVTIELPDVPRITDIEGPKEICPNNIYTYHAIGALDDHYINWDVIGGTIINNNGNYIDIQWGNYTGMYRIKTFHTQSSEPHCKSATILIDVKPINFNLLAITGDSYACVNNNSNYSVSPSPSQEYYEWTISPATAGSIDESTQGTSNVNIQWGAIPTEGVVVEVSVCDNTTAIEVDITDFEPALEIESDTLCPNGSLILNTNIVSSDYSFIWIDEENNTISTNSTATISNAGCYAVTVTSNISGCAESAAICIDNIPEGNYSISTPDSDICVNENIHDVTIYAPIASNINTYEWFCNGASVQGPNGSSSYVHQGNTTIGTWGYHVDITTTDNCTFSSNMLNVRHATCEPSDCQPDPSSIDFTWTSDEFCNEFTFTPDPLLNAPHQWFFDDGGISGDQMPTYTFNEIGYRNVKLNVIVPNLNPPPANCTITRTHTDVLVPVSSSFTYKEGCANTPVIFTSTSQTIDPNTTIIDYECSSFSCKKNTFSILV